MILILLIVFFLLIIGAVVAGVWLFQQNSSPSMGRTAHIQKSSQDEALDILRRRYASGEISKEEYEQMKRDITR